MQGIQKQSSHLYLEQTLNNLVDKNHPYRKIIQLIDFADLLSDLEYKIFSKNGKPGISLIQGFKCLLLQFWEDLSDRQLEKYIKENICARWFCGYKLDDATPDHSYFGKLRNRIGIDNLTELFNKIIVVIKQKGFIGGAFYFVDASSLLSKVNIWEARDKAINDKNNNEKDKEGKPKLNNNNVEKYSSDKDAKFGCKGKNKFWFGYKRHVCIDMKQGIITKVQVTSADVSDGKAFVTEDLCPKEGMVFMDKGYVGEEIENKLLENGCANAVIQKNNSKKKNRYLDKWRSSIRMPFENIFSKLPKITYYRTKPKVKFQIIFQSLVHNLKRVVTVNNIIASKT